MLIYYCCRLRAAVAIRAIEIQGLTLCLQTGHLNAVPRFIAIGCVTPHIFTVVLLSVLVLGIRCATLEQETLSLAGSAAGQYLCGALSEKPRGWSMLARLRWPHAGVALSRSLHPSRGHFQSSLVGLRTRTRNLPLEGLRSRRQARQDDWLERRSSYVASFCTCYPKASSASVTSAFSTMACGLPAWRWADNYLAPAPRCWNKFPHSKYSPSSSPWHCPRCGATMVVIQRFTPAELAACMYFDSPNASVGRGAWLCESTPMRSCIHLRPTASFATSPRYSSTSLHHATRS
jgi:hypothetical protein